MVRPLLLTSSILIVSGLTAFAGCSSSSTSGNSPIDSGKIETGTGHETGAGSSSGSSSGSGGDSGGTTTCPDNTSFSPMTFAAPVVKPGACAPADITAFETACGDTFAQAACQTWFDTNTASDAGAGTACGNCINGPNNTGAVWTDQNLYFGPNYGACIALTDTTNGATCAPAFDAANDCQGFLCDDCASNTTFATCAQTVNASGGACNTFASAAETSCSTDFADGGALDACEPGAATNTLNPDWTLIINLICGGGSDAGGGG